MKTQDNHKRLRILHISSALTWRGGENQLFTLVRELEDLCEQFVLCPEGSLLSSKLKNASVETILFQKRSAFGLRYGFVIKKLVYTRKIDVIHVHDAHAHNYAFLSSLFGNKRPILVTRRVDFKPSILAIFKYNHSQVKRVVCVSNHVKSVLIHRGVDKKRLCTIHSGITDHQKNDGLALNEKLGWNKSDVVIGFVGALVAHKSPLVFLQVAKELTEKQMKYRFIMCGQPGELMESVNEFISVNGLGEHVSYLGYKDDTADVWATLDLLLVTSEMEGLGTAVLEAMSKGIPVVSSDTGGLKEIIKHKHNGLLCKHNDIRMYKESISTLLSNKKQREEYTKNGLKTVSEFSAKKMAENYVQIYNEVVY